MSTEHGWYGVDFDGTLVEYHGWEGPTHAGQPIKPMVELVKRMLAEGKRVKIFSARVSRGSDQQNVAHREYQTKLARSFIESWCEEHLGQRLEVTNVKDFGMIRLYDDRCVQVVSNTGELATDVAYRDGARDERAGTAGDLS